MPQNHHHKLCPFLNQDKAIKWISHLQTLPQDPGHIQTQCSPLISLNVKLHTSFKQQLKMLNKYWLMRQSRVCTNLQVEWLVTVRPQLCLFTKEWTNCLQIFLMFNMYNNSYYSQFVTMCIMISTFPFVILCSLFFCKSKKRLLEMLWSTCTQAEVIDFCYVSLQQ